MRCQFNLAFFKRLVIHDEGAVSGELGEPFDVILGEELRRAAAVREAESLAEAIDQAERDKKQRPPEPESVMAAPQPSLPLGATVGVRRFWCARVDSNHHGP
jgi:hypothetical protein